MATLTALPAPPAATLRASYRPASAAADRPPAGFVHVCVADDAAGLRLYDDFVQRRSGDSPVFGRSGHAELERQGLGHPLYFLALRGDEVTGVLPLFARDTAAARELVTLPGAPEDGILADDELAHWALYSQAHRYAGQRDASIRAGTPDDRSVGML